MEGKYHNYSIDQCNAMMMELLETEKQRMETTNQYLPITMYNAIMLLMQNEKQINLETLCNKFPFFLYNAKMLFMEYEKHFKMETTCNNFSITLYNSMMILMGKEKHIHMRRTALDVKDKLYNEASEYKCHVNTGSRKEGFIKYFTDLDCFCYPTRHRVVWSLTEMHSHDPVTDD